MTPREQWQQEGYVIVRGLHEPERVQRLLEVCESILAIWRRCNPENGKDCDDPNATCMRHLNHPGYFREHPEWRPFLLDAVADSGVLSIARAVLNEEPLFRCTSLFFNPSEKSVDGNWHRDSQFWTPNDETEKKALQNLDINGTSIQMQIALVPSDDVELVPGSHRRWDTPEEYQVRKADGQANNTRSLSDSLRVSLQPGDAVLFNPMGLHRGRYHAEKLRRTLMLTFTRTSSPYYDYFSFQPWCLEPGYLEGVKNETRAFFDAFIDLYTESWKTASSQ
ncbi:MAG: phytanoyl-CoA dioxygenase family protein [candidate division Zixibacteria bacterium]|nr:phytanoyl-CoA dioxygenase family protein [candidate division Zixibacteria bacterium]